MKISRDGQRATSRDQLWRRDYGHRLAGLEAVEIAGDILGQRLRRAVEHHAALRHADEAVAIVLGDVEVVQVADHRDAEVLVQPEQAVHHDLGVAGIERGDRLVGEDDIGSCTSARAMATRCC